jgi:hypothetical protein
MVKVLQALISKFFNSFLQAFLNHLVAKIGTTSAVVVGLANDLNADKSLSGSDKAKKLADQLKTLAITTGKEAPNSLINMVVETAVSVLNGGIK